MGIHRCYQQCCQTLGVLHQARTEDSPAASAHVLKHLVAASPCLLEAGLTSRRRDVLGKDQNKFLVTCHKR